VERYVSRINHKGVANDQFPEIREHFQKNIGDVYKGLDLDFRGFPESNIRDAEACTCLLLPMNVADE
jgi:D-galacturonate reductase